MKKVKKVFTLIFSIYLSGCVSTESIKLNSDPSVEPYKCLVTNSQTIIERIWNTCPLFSSNPVIDQNPQRWDIIPNPSTSYLEFINGKKHLLNKNMRRCEIPSLITEYFEIPVGTKVKVLDMVKHENPSFSGIIFNGEINYQRDKYKVHYRRFLKRSDDPIGYDLSKDFNFCSNNEI